MLLLRLAVIGVGTVLAQIVLVLHPLGSGAGVGADHPGKEPHLGAFLHGSVVVDHFECFIPDFNTGNIPFSIRFQNSFRRGVHIYEKLFRNGINHVANSICKV